MLFTLVVLVFFAPNFSEIGKQVPVLKKVNNPFSIHATSQCDGAPFRCEWAGECYGPGESIRPDLWCVAVCDVSGDWMVTCD